MCRGLGEGGRTAVSLFSRRFPVLLWVLEIWTHSETANAENLFAHTTEMTKVNSLHITLSFHTCVWHEKAIVVFNSRQSIRSQKRGKECSVTGNIPSAKCDTVAGTVISTRSATTSFKKCDKVSKQRVTLRRNTCLNGERFCSGFAPHLTERSPYHWLRKSVLRCRFTLPNLFFQRRRNKRLDSIEWLKRNWRTTGISQFQMQCLLRESQAFYWGLYTVK